MSSAESSSDFPLNRAKVAVIGGGIMGCSLLYHLAHEGWTDSILFEKAELTSGSTWHAAGQITHSVSSYAIGKMAGYGLNLYKRIEEETGQSVTMNACGSLRLAYTEDELDWLKYTYSVGQYLGHPMEIVEPERIRELHPFYNLDGVIGALHTPEDGHVDPSGAAFAFAKGARQLGATVMRDNRVTMLEQQAGGGWLVSTEKGNWLCEIVVNAAGSYARQVGKWVGLDLPITNMTHHYIVTDAVPEFMNLEKDLPVVRDDRLVSGYIRMEQKSGLIGIYEKANPNTVWDDETPWDEVNKLFPPDYDRIWPWLDNAFGRMPIFKDLGIKRAVHGAITHPPDGNLMLGPAPGLDNFWCCCGSQIGIAWGPGSGKYLAQWMVHGAADINMRAFDPRRFGKWIDDTWRLEKAKEDYLLRHEIPYPGLDRPACRPYKTSGLYDILKDKGAVFEEIFGWERPAWYAPEGMKQEHIHSFRRTEVFDVVKAEAKGLREHAAIADMTAFAKLEVTGKDAYDFLNRMCASRIPKKLGGMALGYLLTRNGRIEFEVTIAKLAEDHYYLVCAAVKEIALKDWLEHHKQNDEKVAIHVVSNNYGVLALAGPKSREILAACTDAALDNDSFRWLTAKEIEVAGVKVRALRVSYTGDLGWELHTPIEHMPTVYQALWEAGESEELIHAGMFAFNSLRMEKGYPAGTELTNEVTMVEAGLERFMRLDKSYQGVETNKANAETGAEKWQLVYLELDDDKAAQVNADPIGSESVWFDGEPIGTITSSGYGHTVNKPLAFAYIKPAHAAEGTDLNVLIMNEFIPAKVRKEAAFDPKNVRPRA